MLFPGSSSELSGPQRPRATRRDGPGYSQTAQGCFQPELRTPQKPPEAEISKVRCAFGLCPTLCTPMDYTVHGILQARILEWVSLPPSPGYLLNPGIEPRSPILQEDSLPAEPSRKPKNTGVGGLSLLQWIFPTRDRSPVSHTAGRFYQLSHRASPGCALEVGDQEF